MKTPYETLSKAINKITEALGHPIAFVGAFIIVAVWVVGLPFAGWDNSSYQLLINSTTTVITFLICFSIQHTANRETKALMLKLDELINAIPEARNELIGAEELTEDEIEDLKPEPIKKPKKTPRKRT